MKAYRAPIMLIVFWLIIGCKPAPKPIQHLPDKLQSNFRSTFIGTEEVSLIALIGNPKQYDGHHVRVMGFLNLEFEGNEIFVHKEDYDESISKNGLWVEMDRDSVQLPQVRACIKKNVLMEGTFDANNQGHMGMCSGAIKNVTRLQVWTPVLKVLPPRKKSDNVHFPPSKH